MQQQQANLEINEKLIEAAENINYPQLQLLIQQGANVNYVKYTDANCWYSGNTHSPLYSAVHSKKIQGKYKEYVDVIELLLKNGANPNFKAVRGGWNHQQSYPTFNGVLRVIPHISQMKERIRLIENFVKRGIKINQPQHHGRDKGWRSHHRVTYFIFNMMDLCGIRSKISELENRHQNIDISQIRRHRYLQLRKLFNLTHGILDHQKQQSDSQVQAENPCHPSEPQKSVKQSEQVDTSLIEALIDFGADVNSTQTYTYWENYDPNYAEEEETINEESQSLLHRAIMNNLTGLVKLLLEKGANVNSLCRYTYTQPIYPSEWTEQVRLRKIHKNQIQLENSINEKYRLLKAIQKQKLKKESKKRQVNEGSEDVTETQVPEKQGDDQQVQDKSSSAEQGEIADETVKEIEFEIFKAECYEVEKDNPYMKGIPTDISCLELAKSLGVDSDIIQLLAKHGQQQKQDENQ